MLASSTKTLARASVPYAKMNGIGNQILVVDLRGGGALSPATARRIGTEPRFAFDQLMAIEDPRATGSEAFVSIYNIDGSEAGACGNGTRCVAWFMLEGSDRRDLVVDTTAGRLDCRRDGDRAFTVDMGAPRFDWRDIPLRDSLEDTRAVRLDPPVEGAQALGPFSAVSMGNPHAIFWVDPAAGRPAVERLGPALEHHSVFPDRANISFARIEAPARIRLDVWERGAGVTRACGSAACATVVAAVRVGRADRRVDVVLPGGTLGIEWRETDGHVLMSGLVELEHRGELDLGRWDAAA